VNCELRATETREQAGNRVLSSRVDADFSAVPISFEFHHAIDQCEQRVVTSEADIKAGMKLSPPLPYDDASGRDLFTTECFHTAILRITIAAVSG